MLRFALLISTLFLTFNLSAQHRTEIDQNGERLSERTDINGNKQGYFIFYNNSDQKIRIDNFINGKLTKRECYVEDKGFEDHTEGTISKLIGNKKSIEEISQISKQSGGEIHIQADGTFKIYFYSPIENQGSAVTTLTRIISEKSYSDFTILTF